MNNQAIQWWPSVQVEGVTLHRGPGGEYGSIETPDAAWDGTKVVKTQMRAGEPPKLITLVSPGEWLDRDNKGRLRIVPLDEYEAKLAVQHDRDNVGGYETPAPGGGTLMPGIGA